MPDETAKKFPVKNKWSILKYLRDLRNCEVENLTVKYNWPTI